MRENLYSNERSAIIFNQLFFYPNMTTYSVSTFLILQSLIQPWPAIKVFQRIPSAEAHGYVSSPRSRNFVAYEDGQWWVDEEIFASQTIPQPETCPHCLNWGGTLARCGMNSELRSYDTPFSSNNDGYGGTDGERMPFTPQATYEEGGFIDIETTVTTYHKGHFLFKLCPLNDPLEIPTQECFDEHPLMYVEDLLNGAERDENYPYRAYLGGSQLTSVDDPDSPYSPSELYEGTFLHRFQLPEGVTGEWVLLQWHWLTANRYVCVSSV